MNTFKKFNTYLLTKQPLLWHSRFIQLTLVMLLLHLVFYIVGYNSVDLKKMGNDWRIQSWFFKEIVLLYWILVGLIVLIVWGAFFYRNNAAKNFYPISRWYFHKLALCIFIPAFLFLLIPFTFFSGLSSQAKKIISLNELQELNTTAQFAQPFLLNMNDSFEYPRRSFPDAYDGVQYWEKQSADHYMPTYLYNGKETNIFEILKKEGAQPLDTLSKIYAFRTELLEIPEIHGNDTCMQYEIAFSHALSQDSLVDFKIAHVKNYNPPHGMNRNLFKVKRLKEQDDTQREYIDASDLAAVIHHWIDHEPNAIYETLQQFKTLLDKYQIQHDIHPKKNFDYLVTNDFYFYKELTVPYYYFEDDYYTTELLSEPTIFDEDTLDLESINFGVNHYFQYLDDDQLNTLIENASEVHLSNYFYNVNLLKTMGYIALAATMLLVYFQWANVLSFVISIPVAGVLIFVGALFYALINRPWAFDDNPKLHSDMLIYFLLAGSVLIVAYFGVKQIWNSYLTDVALTISYFVWPLWVTLLLIFLQSALSTNVYNPCEYWPDRVEPFSLQHGPAALFMLYSPYAMFWIWLFFVKRIVAKKVA